VVRFHHELAIGFTQDVEMSHERIRDERSPPGRFECVMGAKAEYRSALRDKPTKKSGSWGS